VSFVTTVDGLLEHAGREVGPTEWRTVEQSMVAQFADLTDDHNPVHLDAGFAARTPFKRPIAHGFLTLSLLAPLVAELVRVEDAALSVNYGLDRVRFPAPVPVGARVRARGELTEASSIPGGVQVKLTVTVEVEDGEKPAVAAEFVLRHYARTESPAASL
jgi:acyl dehydratase